MTNQKRGLFINNGFMALHGLASVMIGTTLPEIIESFDLSLAQGGFIVTAQGVAGVLIMFAGMLVADRIRKPVWVIGSMVGAGLGIAAIGLAPGYWFLVMVFFVTGAFAQIADTLLNAFTGEIAPSTRTKEMNLLHMMYGIGAFVGPTFARWLLNRSFDWSGVYWLVGAIYLTAAAGSLVWIRIYLGLAPRAVPRASGAVPARAAVAKGSPAPTPAPDAPAPAQTRESRGPVTRRTWATVALLGLVVMFYSVHQLSTTAWLPLYMKSTLGVSTNLASVTLSLYWVGIIISRYLSAHFGSRLGEMRILILGSVLGGIALIASVILAVPAAGLVGFVFAGVATGSTIPIGMALAYGHLPGRTGVATSIVYGLMMFGRLFGPWVVGSVGDHLGLGSGILISAAVLLVAAVVAGIVALRDRRDRLT